MTNLSETVLRKCRTYKYLNLASLEEDEKLEALGLYNRGLLKEDNNYLILTVECTNFLNRLDR